jgi:hypothetical protein
MDLTNIELLYGTEQYLWDKAEALRQLHSRVRQGNASYRELVGPCEKLLAAYNSFGGNLIDLMATLWNYDRPVDHPLKSVFAPDQEIPVGHPQHRDFKKPQKNLGSETVEKDNISAATQALKNLSPSARSALLEALKK